MLSSSLASTTYRQDLKASVEQGIQFSQGVTLGFLGLLAIVALMSILIRK